MLGFERRVDAEELMDRPDVTREDVERSLSDLETVNRWLGGRGALLPHVLPLVGECSSFLDVACGSGDMLRAICDRARRIGKDVRLVGLDLNPVVLDVARDRCRCYPNISFVQGNAIALPFGDGSFDVVYSSTFLHHLEPELAVRAISEAARVAERRMVSADLVRSIWGWVGVWFVGRLAFGRLSRHDGLVSFRRAYSADELSQLADQARLSHFRVYTHRLFRIALVRDAGESTG